MINRSLYTITGVCASQWSRQANQYGHNDSATPCGSCVDRHAYIGSGHIGIETMNTIATLCSQNGLPMVIE